jgi:hypothetical protein
VPLVGLSPAVTYPIAFWVTLLAVVWFGRAERLALDETWPAPGPVPVPKAAS